MNTALDGVIRMMRGGIPDDHEIEPITKITVQPALQAAVEAAQDARLALHEEYKKTRCLIKQSGTSFFYTNIQNLVTKLLLFRLHYGVGKLLCGFPFITN